MTLKPSAAPGAVFKSRIGALDGLRGVAILTVIFFHYFSHSASLTGRAAVPYADTYAGFFLFKYGY